MSSLVVFVCIITKGVVGWPEALTYCFNFEWLLKKQIDLFF